MKYSKFTKYLLILVLFLLIFYLLSSFFHFEIEPVVNFFDSLGPFAYIVFILLLMTEVVFAPLHPLVFYVAGGIIFGPWIALLLSLIGEGIGSTIAFKIAKKYGRNFVESKFPKKKLEYFDRFSKKYGSLSIFFLRVNPITSSDAWTYIAGISKMRYDKFIVASLLGLAPAIFIQVYFGEAIKENPILMQIFVTIAAIYFLVAIGSIIYLSVKNKQKAK